MKIDYKPGYGYLHTPAWKPQRAQVNQVLG
jgi:hypothetical protein